MLYSTAASPSLSGRSSPIVIDDDENEYTVVEEVGDKTDNTDEDKVRGEGVTRIQLFYPQSESTVRLFFVTL